MPELTRRSSKLRARTHEIIFEADTPAGRAFDIASMTAIIVSVAAVILESIGAVRTRHGELLRTIEWLLTGLFTIDYALRLVTVHKPLRYASSFYGLVDLLSVLPSYLSLIWPGSQSLLVIRSLRLLRIFRVLKLVRFLDTSTCLVRAATFVVSSALLATSSALRAISSAFFASRSARAVSSAAIRPTAPVSSSAWSPTATGSLDHDRIRLSIRLETENTGG